MKQAGGDGSFPSNRTAPGFHPSTNANPPYFAGFDWAGTPSRSVWFIPCIAAVPDGGALRDLFRVTRSTFGYPPEAEFHGHSCPPAVQTQLLSGARGLGLKVGAAIIKAGSDPVTQLAGRMEQYVGGALLVLAPFLERFPLVRLDCDTDLEGQRAQQRFATEVKRLHRRIWPGTRINVRFTPSQSSELVQLADTAAYGLSRLVRGTLDSPELRRVIEAIGEEGIVVDGDGALRA